MWAGPGMPGCGDTPVEKPKVALWLRLQSASLPNYLQHSHDYKNCLREVADLEAQANRQTELIQLLINSARQSKAYGEGFKFGFLNLCAILNMRAGAKL